MTTKLPSNYKYYRVTLFTKVDGCGPFDVITDNTVNATRTVQEAAHEKYPDGGFLTAEAMWVESDNEPPADLVAQFEANLAKLET